MGRDMTNGRLVKEVKEGPRRQNYKASSGNNSRLLVADIKPTKRCFGTATKDFHSLILQGCNYYIQRCCGASKLVMRLAMFSVMKCSAAATPLKWSLDHLVWRQQSFLWNKVNIPSCLYCTSSSQIRPLDTADENGASYSLELKIKEGGQAKEWTQQGYVLPALLISLTLFCLVCWKRRLVLIERISFITPGWSLGDSRACKTNPKKNMSECPVSFQGEGVWRLATCPKTKCGCCSGS